MVIAIAASLAFTLLPAHGGADLTLYRRMARVAIAGGNPYADPYADFPPLKMLVLTLLERADLWAVFRSLGFAALVAVTVLFAAAENVGPAAFVGALTLCLQPLVYQNWISPFEDKWIYPLLFIPLLRAARRDTLRGPGASGRAASVWLGILSAYSGVTMLVAPLLALEIRRRTHSWRRALESGLVIAGIVAASHAAFFPGWLAGYSQRIARQSLETPGHESLFVLVAHLGLYSRALPNALTLAVLIAALLVWWRSRRLEPALVLGYFALFALGPEASYDRILAGAFPIYVLLLRRPLAVTSVIVLMLIVASRVGSPDLTDSGRVALLWAPVVVGLGAWAWHELRPPARDERLTPDPSG
jgi:hypothetical protein